MPDAPTIGLVADTDGIATIGSVTGDTTPTVAGTAHPAGPVMVRDGEGTLLATVTSDATTTAWSYTSATALTDRTYAFTATYEPTGDWPSNAATASVTAGGEHHRPDRGEERHHHGDLLRPGRNQPLRLQLHLD